MKKLLAIFAVGAAMFVVAENQANAQWRGRRGGNVGVHVGPGRVGVYRSPVWNRGYYGFQGYSTPYYGSSFNYYGPSWRYYPYTYPLNSPLYSLPTW